MAPAFKAFPTLALLAICLLPNHAGSSPQPENLTVSIELTIPAEKILSECSDGDDICLRFVEGHPSPAMGGGPLFWSVGRNRVALTKFQAWRQMRCLAYAAWAEARGEGTEGMLAVMQVITNRAAEGGYPDTPCLNVAKHGQFEAMFFKRAEPWLNAARNKKSMVPDIARHSGADEEAARTARILAWRLMTGQIDDDIARGATFYATRDLVESGRTPSWVKIFIPVTSVGEHIFFRPPEREERA